jgi:WD40 repeat protein
MSGFGGVVDKPTVEAENTKQERPDSAAITTSNQQLTKDVGAEGTSAGGKTESGGTSQNVPVIHLRKSLGISGFCRDNVVFSSPTTIAYPLGKQLVFYDLITGEMRYLARSRTARKVTAMAIDSTLASLAVCEQSSPDGQRAQIHIIHCSMMKKTRTILSQALGDIVSCAFASTGSRELVTLNLTNEDYVITLWKWSQSKVLASATANINLKAGHRIRRLRFKPNDGLLTSSGAKHLRLWTIDANNSTLKQAPILPLKREQDIFIEQVWLKDCLVVLTSERILSFTVDANGQVSEYGAAVEGDFQRIESMAAHGSKGFILGGRGGTFSVYEMTADPAEPFMHLKKFQGEPRDIIMGMDVAPNLDNVVCFLEGSHLSLFPISNIDLLKTEDNNFQQLIRDGVHSDAITSMDTCFQRPIVVTAGRDQRINIWNYRTWECLLTDKVTDEPSCIACHPTGSLLLVGSKERVRFYNILADKLALFVEVPNLKNCRQAQFSHGGQYFAVTAGLNILIYLTYELRCVRTLTGHISPPTCLLWSQDDALFFFSWSRWWGLWMAY